MRSRIWPFVAVCGVLSCATGSEPITSPPPGGVTASTISVVAGSGQSATVGAALPAAVTFEVRGSNGQPFAGATVTFSATNGGSASPASGTTGANGRVSTTWTLGSAVTTQTLTASAGGTITTTVTANATSGGFVTIASVAIMSGSGQSAFVSSALSTPIVVEVRGSNSLPYQYANVTFSATNQGTTSPASGVTDAAGRLSITWTLGPTATTQSLTAYAGTYTATVSAVAMANASCTASTALTLGATVNGSLAAGDCSTLPTGSGGIGRTDRFAITRPAGDVMEQYDLTSTAFDTYLRLRDGAGRIVAEHDNRVAGSNSDSRIILFAASGALTAEVTSAPAGATGAYALTTGSTNAHPGVSCNVIAWVLPGTNMGGQHLNTADCITAFRTGAQTSGDRYYRRYYLYLAALQTATITISEESGSFDPFLVVRDVLLGTFVSDDNSGGGRNPRLVITGAAGTVGARLYYIDVTSLAPQYITGYFNITVN